MDEGALGTLPAFALEAPWVIKIFEINHHVSIL